MKLHKSLFGILAAASSILAAPAPVPDGPPINADLCGLLGTDLDLTPESSLNGEFKLQAQKYDFTGPTFYVGSTPSSVSQFALSNSDEAHTFTFKDGVLYTDGDVPTVVLFQFLPKLVRFFLGFSRNAKFAKVPWIAKHVCDPVSKETALVLEYDKNHSEGSQGEYSAPRMKD